MILIVLQVSGNVITVQENNLRSLKSQLIPFRHSSCKQGSITLLKGPQRLDLVKIHLCVSGGGPSSIFASSNYETDLNLKVGLTLPNWEASQWRFVLVQILMFSRVHEHILSLRAVAVSYYYVSSHYPSRLYVYTRVHLLRVRCHSSYFLLSSFQNHYCA